MDVWLTDILDPPSMENYEPCYDQEMKSIVRPVLEKHLRTVPDSLNTKEIGRVEACADKVQTAASADLGNMGLGMVSFTIGHVRVG